MRKSITQIFLVIFIPLEAAAQPEFIRFNNYLIPITPNVYYIDDVDDSRQPNSSSSTSFEDADPNGVQELAVLIGWKNLKKFNLVGVGAEGKAGANFNTAFTAHLLNLMGDATSVLTGAGLRDSLIQKALLQEHTGSRLNIVIGGPRDIILDAIDHADSLGTPIKDFIRVIGVQACVSGNSVTNCPVPTVGPAIEAAVGPDNYHIVVGDGDPNTIAVEAPSFRWFYKPTLTHVGNRNSWYQSHYHQSQFGRYLRDNNYNGFKLDEQAMVINACTEYQVPVCDNKAALSNVPTNLRRVFRAADFTALAYLIWGDNIWSTDFKTRMYDELEAGLDTLPK